MLGHVQQLKVYFIVSTGKSIIYSLHFTHSAKLLGQSVRSSEQFRVHLEICTEFQK